MATEKKKFSPLEAYSSVVLTKKKKKPTKSKKTVAKKQENKKTNNGEKTVEKRQPKTKHVSNIRIENDYPEPIDEPIETEVITKKSSKKRVLHKTLEIRASDINSSQESIILAINNEQGNENVSDKTRLYTFVKNNKKREFTDCSEGVGIAALSACEGLMQIAPGATTKTNEHELKFTYFVQEGECLLSLDGIVSKHSKADVFTVPKGSFFFDFFKTFFKNQVLIFYSKNDEKTFATKSKTRPR